MKGTGFRKMDGLGRVTVPSEYREKYDLLEHDEIDFILREDGILLKKVYDKCIFCGSRKNLINYHNKTVCSKCRKAIQ